MLCDDLFDETRSEMKITKVVVVNKKLFLCDSMFPISCGLLEDVSTQSPLPAPPSHPPPIALPSPLPRESLIWEGGRWKFHKAIKNTWKRKNNKSFYITPDAYQMLHP